MGMAKGLTWKSKGRLRVVSVVRLSCLVAFHCALVFRFSIWSSVARTNLLQFRSSSMLYVLPSCGSFLQPTKPSLNITARCELLPPFGCFVVALVQFMQSIDYFRNFHNSIKANFASRTKRYYNLFHLAPSPAKGLPYCFRSCPVLIFAMVL